MNFDNYNELMKATTYAVVFPDGFYPNNKELTEYVRSFDSERKERITRICFSPLCLFYARFKGNGRRSLPSSMVKGFRAVLEDFKQEPAFAPPVDIKELTRFVNELEFNNVLLHGCKTEKSSKWA